MLYSLSGKLTAKTSSYLVVECGGFGFKVTTSAETLGRLPLPPSDVKLHCNLIVREDHLELYGFLSESELRLFELFTTVSGVGPKTAVNILGVAPIDQLKAAIAEGKPDLITKASGIGKKTADRLILELRNKISAPEGAVHIAAMEVDMHVEEALVALGYTTNQAREATKHIGKSITGIEARVKEALKILNKKK